MAIPQLTGQQPAGIAGAEAGVQISILNTNYVPGGAPTVLAFDLQGVHAWRQSGKQTLIPYTTRPGTPYPDVLQSGMEPSTIRLSGTWYRGFNPFLLVPSFTIGQRLLVKLIVVATKQAEVTAATGYVATAPAIVSLWDISAEVDGRCEWIFELTAIWKFQDFSGQNAGLNWLGMGN